MTGIVEFLTAQLDSDQAAAEAADAVDPARALREVAAKRRVLERHHPAAEPHWRNRPTDPLIFDCVGCGDEGDLETPRNYIHECPELLDMAEIYVDRSGYKEAWLS